MSTHHKKLPILILLLAFAISCTGRVTGSNADASTDACTPLCYGMVCGAGDGCGGVCTLGSGCACSPDCAGKLCGVDDGCGQSCAWGSGCCAPDCSGRQCGEDGCGGNCGDCAAGSYCQAGACVVSRPDASSPADGGACRGRPGTEFGSLTARGVTRYYAVHAPAGYAGCDPTALVLFFHGTDMSNVDNPRANEEQYIGWTGLASDADTRGYITAFPTARAFTGTRGTALVWALPFQFQDEDVRADDDFVDALIEELGRSYNVDGRRIYISGFSQGGFYVSHLFPTRSYKFAAFAMHGAVCASTWECPGSPSRIVPGFVRIGSSDEVVSEADAAQFHRQLLGAGWEDGVTLDFSIVQGMSHTYNAEFNAAQWEFFSRFSL